MPEGLEKWEITWALAFPGLVLILLCVHLFPSLFSCPLLLYLPRLPLTVCPPSSPFQFLSSQSLEVVAALLLLTPRSPLTCPNFFLPPLFLFSVILLLRRFVRVSFSPSVVPLRLRLDQHDWAPMGLEGWPNHSKERCLKKGLLILKIYYR